MKLFNFSKKSKTKNVRMRLLAGVVCLGLIAGIVFTLFHPTEASAVWFDDNYAYRKPISFVHNADITTDRRVTVTIDTATLITAGKMQSDCDDSRFTDLNGRSLRYQLTGTCNNASTTYDVVYPSVINGINTSYFYYGNPSATSESQDVSGVTTLTPSGSISFSTEEKALSPAGWWKFDSGTGTTAYDATQNANNGTLGGTIGGVGGTGKIRQEINIIDTNLSGTNAVISSNGQAQLDTTVYDGTPTYYFEVVASATAGSTGSIRLRRSGTTTDDTTINLTTVAADSGNVRRYRSASFTPPASTQTTYFAYVDAAGAAKTVTLKAARIIVLQSSTSNLTKTEAQFEIGNMEAGKSNTAVSPLDNPKYWTYTSANWSPAPAFYAEATYKITQATTPTTETFTVAGSSTWQAPVGVTSVDVELWGGGGAGGGGTNTGTPGGSGGGGGAYAKSTVAVTPLTSYSYTVGSAGTGSAGAGGNGGNSTFNTSTVIAEGGKGGAANGGAAGVGGNTTVSVGDVEFAGGTGFVAVSSTGGGGGGSGGSASNGNNATSQTGATAVTGGGPGGTGAFVGGNGSAPASGPGGGGGGSGQRSGASETGGNGFAGKASFTYSLPDTDFVTVKLQEDDGSFANWTDVTNGGIVSLGSATTATRVRTSTPFFPTNGHHYRIVSGISNSASTYDIYNAKIVAVSDSTYAPFDGDNDVNYSGSTCSIDAVGDNGCGQSFQPTISGSLTRAQFLIAKSGTPTGNLVAKLYAHTGTFGTSSAPTGTALATSDNLSVASLTSNQTLYTFNFTGAQQYSLVSGTNYVITVEYNGTSASSVALGIDGNNHHNGNFSSKFNTTWSTSSTFDLVFHVYYNTTKLTTTESQYLIANTGSIGGSTGLKDYDTSWDPAEWSSVTNTYYQEGNGVSSGTGDLKLQSDPNGTPTDVTNSTITDTIESELSSALTMPAAAADIDVNVTGTGTLNASKIIVSSTLGTIGAGTSVSAPTWKNKDDCLTEGCLYFPGSDAAVKITNADPIDFDKGLAAGVTFSAWIKANDAGEGSSGYIFSKGTNTYLKVGNLSGGKLDLIGSIDLGTTDATVTVTGGLTQNKWHYVAMGYTDDGDDELTLYIDGNATSSTNGVGSPATDTNDLVIGHNASSGGTFHGYIDDFRVFNFERSSSQIKTIAANILTPAKGASAILGAARKNFLTDGLVANWRMNENTGTTISDSSGNGYTSSAFTGNTTWATGKFNTGLTFDGIDDVVRIPVTTGSAADLGATTDSYTVSAWINFTACSGTTCTIVSKDGSATKWPFILQMNTSGTACTPYIYDGTTSAGGLCTGNTYNDGAWHLVTGIRDSNEKKLKIYVDGAFLFSSTDTTTASAVNTSDISIGNGSTSYITNDFSGKIDDVRVYNRALSDSEVSQLYDWAPGPTGYWKLDEKTGTSVKDSSGNGYTGTVTGAATLTSGKYGGGVTIGNSTNRIDMGDQSGLEFPAGFTLEAWFYRTGTCGTFTDCNIITKGQSSTTGYALKVKNTGSGYTARLGIKDSDQVTGATSLGTNQWYHIVGTVDGTTAKIYVNGVLDGSASQVNTPTYSTESFKIGNGNDNNDLPAEGIIDDVRVYNYARTAKQVVSDMNGGHPAVGSPVGSALVYWKFDEGANNTCSGGTNDVCNSGSGGSTYDGAESGTVLTNSGKFGKARTIDTNTDTISMGDQSFVDGANSMTISMWMNPSSFSSAKNIIGKWTSANTSNNFQVLTTGTGDLQIHIPSTLTNSGIFAFTSGLGITNSVWQHIVIVYDGSQIASNRLKVYRNGILASISFNGTIPTSLTTGSTSSIILGDYAANSQALLASYDDLKIYTTALSSDEIKVDYNQGKAQMLGSGSTTSAGNVADNSSDRSYCVPGDTGTCNAPIGEWNFDEGSGTTANDTSGSGNTGTISNSATPSWTSGKIGKALNFDSTLHTKVDAGTGTSVNNLSALSVSMWVYPRSKGGNSEARFVDKSASTGPTNGWYFKYNSSSQSMVFQVDYSTTDLVQKSVETVPFNQWSHISVTWDGSTSAANVHMYLNGKEVSYTGSTDASGTRADDSTGSFKIGDQQGTNYRTFDGLIDTVHLYNYVRSNSQVAWDYNRGAPVGRWKFDECTGTTANDSSGNGLNGTISAGASGNTSAGNCNSNTTTEMWSDGLDTTRGTSGKFNAGLGFDGIDDTVTVADSTNFNSATASTSVWVYLNQTPSTKGTDEFFIDKVNSTTPFLSFATRAITPTNKVQFCITNASSSVICETTNTALTTNTWYNLVSVYDGANVIGYINGTEDGTRGILTGSLLDSDGIFRIGGDVNPANFPDAILDDIRFYNYPLTPQQVKLIYNGNYATRFGPATGSP